MLARGWLAYPVTSTHSQLPPKCGCICQHPVTNRLFANYYIPHFIQPLFGGRLLLLDRPQVGKPTWGYDYTTAIRRLPSPSDCYRPTSVCINGTVHRHPKNRRSAVVYVSTGLACLPRDIDAFATTAEVRLYKHTEANALQTGSPPKTKFPTAKPQPETV